MINLCQTNFCSIGKRIDTLEEKFKGNIIKNINVSGKKIINQKDATIYLRHVIFRRTRCISPSEIMTLMVQHFDFKDTPYAEQENFKKLKEQLGNVCKYN